MKQTIALTLLLTALAGCTVVWGASYNVVASSPDMIQYEYEVASVNLESMNEAAQKHCGLNSRAVLTERAKGGYEQINTYRCMPSVDVYSVERY